MFFIQYLNDELANIYANNDENHVTQCIIRELLLINKHPGEEFLFFVGEYNALVIFMSDPNAHGLVKVFEEESLGKRFYYSKENKLVRFGEALEIIERYKDSKRDNNENSKFNV